MADQFSKRVRIVLTSTSPIDQNARGLISIMARSTRVNQRPDTLIQDRRR